MTPALTPEQQAIAERFTRWADGALIQSSPFDTYLARVEIGTRAGLNLFWDRYRYDSGAAGQAGDPGAPVLLECEVRGERVPPIPARFPPVARRIGLDLFPVDVRDAAAVHWLRALI